MRLPLCFARHATGRGCFSDHPAGLWAGSDGTECPDAATGVLQGPDLRGSEWGLSASALGPVHGPRGAGGPTLACGQLPASLFL